MRYTRGVWLGVVAVMGAWLGCNVILGNEPGQPRDESVSASSSGSTGGMSSSAGQGGGAGGSSSSASVGQGGAGGTGIGGAGGMVVSGSSSSGAGGGPVTFEWTAVDPGVGSKSCTENYTYVLPDWLVFTSPTVTERTSQVAIDKLCRGYVQDVPRARNAGTGWGLNIESARTNLVKTSDSWTGASWGASNMSQFQGNPDPAGGIKATEFSSSGNQYSSYPQAVNGQVGSAWARGLAGNAPYAHFRHVISGAWIDVVSTTWHRYSVTQADNTNGELALETRDQPVGAGVIAGETKIEAFGAQIEPNALYPSSYIPTDAASVTRMAETLSSVPGKLSELAPGGYFNITLTFAPNFKVSDTTNEMSELEYNIIYFEGKHRLYLQKASRKIALRINNVIIESDPLVFQREQPLTITVTNVSGQGFSLQVSGATEGNKLVSDAQDSPIDVAASKVVTILGDSGGAEECADLRYIKFAPP